MLKKQLTQAFLARGNEPYPAGYEDENALPPGASIRIGNTVVVKATVSDDTENNVGYGAGLSVGW